jgi:hypothetical protein
MLWTDPLDAPVDEEPGVAGLHELNDPRFRFLVRHNVAPRRKRDRDRMRELGRDGMSDGDLGSLSYYRRHLWMEGGQGKRGRGR